MSTKGVILPAAIDGQFGRDVATIDIPNAFLWTDNDGEVLMKLCGQMVELLVALDPNLYRKYIVFGKNGEPVLYVKLLKALYGLLRSAILFYKKLQKELEDMDFKINPYDPCVSKKLVNGSQMTVTWHVDDLNISHKYSQEVTTFILSMGKIYGEGITVTRGKFHSYLGMYFNLSTQGTTKLSMIKYAVQILDDFPGFQNFCNFASS